MTMPEVASPVPSGPVGERITEAAQQGEGTTARVVTEMPSGALATEWRAFLHRADYASHYATPEFFLEPQFRARGPFAVLVRQDGRVVAVATGVLEGRTVQCGLMSRPQLSIDPAADRAGVARALAGALAQVHPGGQAVTLVSWSPLPQLTAAGYREKVYSGEKGIVVLDLRRGADALFREFSESRRANIRKGMRRGIEVAEAQGEDDLTAYYEIYRDWCRGKQQPANDYPLFRETMLTRGNRRLFLARHHGVIVAGVVVRFSPGGVLEYAANASRKADQSIRPNDLLHWRVIEWACAEALTTYSLGGAHLFLRRFGGTIIDTYQYAFDRTFGKRLEMRDRLMDVARRSWRRLPDPLKHRLRPPDTTPPE